LKANHKTINISISYTVIRNVLEPLCTKEVLFLPLLGVSLLFFSLDYYFRKQKTVSYSFLVREIPFLKRFSNIAFWHKVSVSFGFSNSCFIP